MTDTDELTTWFRTTLDAVEVAVIAYRDGHPGPCLNFAGQQPEYYTEYDSCYLHIRSVNASPYRDAAFGLADIAAKRRILDEHQPIQQGFTWTAPSGTVGAERVPDWRCGRCSDYFPDADYDEDTHTSHSWPCLTMRLLAEPLAGREGYREEWRP